MSDINLYLYDHREEIFNWVTHALGMVFSVFAFFSLYSQNTDLWSATHYGSMTVYSASMFGLYSASTLYHFVKNPNLKLLFKKLDHIFIYFLIAGTYTPFLLLSIGGSTGEIFLYLVWGIALCGTVFKYFFTHKFDNLSLVIYIGMAWLSVLLWNPLVQNVPSHGFYSILAGGFFYTVGVFFFVVEKIPYNHGIWHLFVLAGSFCHFLAVKSVL